MRKPWSPGDPCPKCEIPVESAKDKYKKSHNICRPCGQQARREYLESLKEALPSERHCADCQGFISGLSRAIHCAACVAKRRAAGAQKGTQAMVAKRAKERELREATRLPVDPPRPVAQAWPGLRGPGGEWEHGVTNVQGWATLDGTRV